MARKRMLSPEFFTSTTVNALPIPTMVTFAGLWCYADDYGRGEDDAVLIRATVWPRRRSYSEKKVDADLGRLADVGLICRYNIAGYALLHMPTWHEHQQISHKGKEKLPPCSDHEPGLFEMFLRDSGGPLDKFRRVSGNPPETFQRNVVKGNLSKGSSSGDGPSRAKDALRDARRSA